MLQCPSFCLHCQRWSRTFHLITLQLTSPYSVTRMVAGSPKRSEYLGISPSKAATHCLSKPFDQITVSIEKERHVMRNVTWPATYIPSLRSTPMPTVLTYNTMSSPNQVFRELSMYVPAAFGLYAHASPIDSPCGRRRQREATPSGRLELSSIPTAE